jgi:hypothetical protein
VKTIKIGRLWGTGKPLTMTVRRARGLVGSGVLCGT